MTGPVIVISLTILRVVLPALLLIGLCELINRRESGDLRR